SIRRRNGPSIISRSRCPTCTAGPSRPISPTANRYMEWCGRAKRPSSKSRPIDDRSKGIFMFPIEPRTPAVRTAFVAICLLAGAADATPIVYQKMVRTEDALEFKQGLVLRPRFGKMMLRANHQAMVKGRVSSNTAAVERLFQKTLMQLKKEGLVPRSQP